MRDNADSPPARPHRYWHDRGYLPHCDGPGLIQAVTFRLADAVPASLVEQWKRELRLETTSAAALDAVLRRRIARYEDAGYGSCWLARDDVAGVVEAALLHFDGSRYRLLAWCVMPNHVHVVAGVTPRWPLDGIVHSWKSYTAKRSNALLGRRGAFWFPEYHDRYIRDERHLAAARAYVERNPVVAGLVRAPEDWRYSSARRRTTAGGTPALPAPAGP